MKTLTKLLLFSLLIISCQNSNNSIKDELPTFDITQKPSITDVKLSDLGFVDIEYITLEKNEQCIIPGINRGSMDGIVAGDNYFLTYILTKIYMFRYDGSFVTSIGTQGRGPNEFLVFHDIEIDPKSQEIYLVSGWQKKFFVYSESGEIIRTFTSPLNTSDFKFTENGIICYSVNTLANVDTSFTVIDTTGEIIKSFPNKYSWTRGPQATLAYNENIFYRFNDQLFKKEAYSDTVYLIENMNFKPHLVIKHGTRLLTPEARTANDAGFLTRTFISQQNLFEFGDYIYYDFINGFNDEPPTVLIGSKIDNSQLFINSETGFVNDIDGGPNIIPETIKDNNIMITWIDAIQLKKYVASDTFKNSIPKYPNKKLELEKLAATLEDTDNPVLIMVKMKD
jgi:hypothetical protein